MSRVFVLYLFSLTARSLIFAVIAGLLLLRSRRVDVRHAVWTVVLISTILMPIADALLPSTMVPSSVPEVLVPFQTFIVISAPESEIYDNQHAHSSSMGRSIDWWKIAASVVIAVSFVFLLRLVLIFCAIVHIRKASHAISVPAWEQMKASRKFRFATGSLRESSVITVPLTIGLWKPLLILPADWRAWDDWTMEAVLTHEMTHLRRWDWATTVVAALTKCVYWFNPLAWWLERKLSLLAEQASDEACVRSSGDRQRYAETLLHFAAAAKHGHRWIGGVAMAQHKISLRIERILALQSPGSGVLRNAAWAALFLAAVPALYVSAATQSERSVSPSIAVPELRQVLQREIPSPLQLVVAQQAPPVPPQERQPRVSTPTPAAVPQAVAPQEVPVVPPPRTTVTNPDLVGEIRLILAPIDAQNGAGQVQITTRDGTNRFSGTAVWNVRNTALPPAFRGSNNAFVFAVAGVEGRKILLEDSTGSTFSYGCADCSFLVWESGIGLSSNNAEPGVVFRLSPDGTSLAATCRATECRIANGNSIGPLVGTYLTLRNSETRPLGLSTPNRTCFSVFGNVKADGTPFTDADCRGVSLIFSVTR